MKTFLKCILVPMLLVLASLVSTPLQAEESVKKEVAGPLLQTTIHAKALNNSQENQGRIQPGTRVKLAAVVENIGDVPSAPGTIAVRFTFPQPLEKNPSSVLFETESENLPSIPPGETLTVNFKDAHKWPSLFDYIRQNWAMRHYEAIVKIGGKELITGTLPISFYAYYYEGPKETVPQRVSSQDHIREAPRKSRLRRSRG